MNFELIDEEPQSAVIRVIGVGGGGGNAVQHMVDRGVEGVDFICANTDAQALKHLTSRTLMKLGASKTKGLGAGADPSLGKDAAIEDKEKIAEVLKGSDMVFITAGMGGGTGTGAAPIVAEIAKQMGILTVAVVTKPFSFEGKKRLKVADQGIRELALHVDSLITIPNDRLLDVMGQDVKLLDAFSAVDDVLLGAVQGIADLITRPGRMNLDFADVRTVMSEMGMAMMGTGQARGEDRAREAARMAIHSQLLEDIDLHGARGILVNITGGDNITLGEFAAVGETIEEYASDNATVVIGTVIDPSLDEDLRITVVATGLGRIDEEPPIRRSEGQLKEIAGDGKIDYTNFDKPTVIRNNQQQQKAHAAPSSADMEYLDIPAFLRRQAD